MVDEERMRPGHWLGLVLCVPFSALTLMVWWWEGQLDCKKPYFTNLLSSVLEQDLSGTG